MHAKMRDARGPSKATFPLPIAFLPTSNTFFSQTRPGRPAARRGPAVLRFAHPAEAYRWTRWTRGIEYRQIVPTRHPKGSLIAGFSTEPQNSSIKRSMGRRLGLIWRYTMPRVYRFHR